MAKKTRPISQRDTSLSPAGEVRRRVFFLVYVLTASAGFVALAAGLTKHRPALAIAGLLGLGVAVTLHVTRARWGAADVVGEIKANPFKPGRVAKDDED